MTTYAIPSGIPPTSFDLGQLSNTWEFRSPLSGHSQTMEMPAPRWRVVCSWQDLPPEYSASLEAFLVKMRGKANRFTCHNYGRVAPRGTLRGTLTVNQNHSLGATNIEITGGAGQASKTLLEGDFLSINGELKVVVTGGTTNASGIVQITIAPPMRSALTIGASVVWDKPTTTFMLDDNEVRWTYNGPSIVGLSMAGTEVW